MSGTIASILVVCQPTNVVQNLSVGEAMIQFHFQYYWYAIIFLVFDVAFMFMALGGLLAMDATGPSSTDPIDVVGTEMIVLTVFFATMTLGVWHVFRKRGRIYI